MRVLLITDWPLRYAGTERYVSDLRDGLVAAGDEVRLMTSSIGSAAAGTADYVARTTDRRRAQALLQVANPSSVATLRRALREFEPEVVHLTMFLPYLSPAVLAPLAGRPATLAVSDLKPICPNGMKLLPDGRQCRVRMGTVCHSGGCLGTARSARDAVRYGAFRLGLRNIDRIQTCSLHMRDELELAGIDSEHLPLPVPSVEAGFRRRPSPSPRFVYAGRLAPVKGLMLLLEAFNRLLESHPEATLLICGDGRHRLKVIARTDELGLRGPVEFHLGMPWDWTAQLEDAWALVAPSLYREPLGLVAIEAIVRDVPVIASADGGFAESVEEGRTGLLFPNGDADALLHRMRAICERVAFAEHRVDPGSRTTLTRRHDVGDHVRLMQRTWNEIGA